MSQSVARNRWRLAVRLTCGACVWSLGLVLAALLWPSYGGQTISDSNGLTLTSATAVEVNGARALIVVSVPVVASVVVAYALYRRRVHNWRYSGAVAWAAIGVLTVTALVGILSVGAFMLPVAITLALAARLVVGADAVRAEPVRPDAVAPDRGS